MLGKSSMTILGAIMSILGLLIIFAIGKNRFNRRNITGIEVFKSYEDSLITRGGEGCLKIVALGLILGGGSMFLLSLE